MTFFLLHPVRLFSRVSDPGKPVGIAPVMQQDGYAVRSKAYIHFYEAKTLLI